MLMDAARPDLYRANAFRITGLPVFAASREVVKRAERLEIAARIGGEAPASASPFAIVPAPRADAVRDAIDRLRDPEHRLIEELFWFWPNDPADPKNDIALRFLERGETSRAVDVWKSVVLSGSDRGAARHNLAVYTHLCALESGGNGDGGEHLWREAFHCWEQLLDDDACWSRVAARIAELDDPRLTTGLARRIRNDLPAVIVTISASLAIEAAEKKDLVTLRRHAALIRSCGLDAQAVRETLGTAIAPLRQRLRTRCAAVNAEAKEKPRYADALVRQAAVELSSLLLVFDAFFEAGDLTRDGAHDEVALALHDAVDEYVGETEDWLGAATLCESLLKIAVRVPARRKITDSMKKMREYATYGRDWCTPGYFDLPQPVLELLQEARKKARQPDLPAAIAMIAGYIARSGDTRPPVLAPLAWCLSIQANREQESLAARPGSVSPAELRAAVLRHARALLLAHELLPDDPRYRADYNDMKEVLAKNRIPYPSSAELRMALGIGGVSIPSVTVPAASGGGCAEAFSWMFWIFVLISLFRSCSD